MELICHERVFVHSGVNAIFSPPISALLGLFLTLPPTSQRPNCPLHTCTEAKKEKACSCPGPSTHVFFPAGFARRFVASSLQNKLLPQAPNIILEYLMS